MFIRTILLALLSSGATAANLRSGPCDESFPLAPPTRRVTSNNGRSKRHDRRLVAIPPGNDSGEYYETGKYYAPLCPDGRRIDIRELVRCIGEQCYDEEIGFCVYECTWNLQTPQPNPAPTPKPIPAPTPKLTPAPTAKPTFQQEVTEHPLLIILRNLPKQYRMSQEIRAAIIRYMRDKLKYELAQMGLGLELIELSYPGRLYANPNALPLNVKVKGPSDISSFALSYIMQVMRDSNQEIVTQLKKLDGTGGTAFKDLQLSIETYNVNDISAGATNPPSKPPTPAPSKPLSRDQRLDQEPLYSYRLLHSKDRIILSERGSHHHFARTPTLPQPKHESSVDREIKESRPNNVHPTILLALLSSGAAAANLRSGPCDDSFPLAPLTRTVTSNNGRSKRHDRRLVAIPPGDDSGEYYETGEYYAPLCPDGRRIDIRELARCVGDQCYDEDIGFCVYVCTWNTRTPPPTPAPTAKPTFQPEVTEHPLLISLRDLPEQYRMSQEIRAAIVRYMRDKLKYDLEEMGLGMELIELSYPGRLPGNPHALPLNVKVKGPSDISSFALSYIMQVMRDSNQEIVTQLKKLDGTGGTAFKDLQLSIETYNVNDISAGATNPPSKSPTPWQSEPVKTKTAGRVTDADEGSTIPWWVWLIVVLVILCLCICCCCFYILRGRRDADKNNSEKGQEVNVFMQNHVPGKYRRRAKPSQQSVAESKTTRRSRRPPISIDLSADDQSRRTARTTRTHKTTRSSRPPGLLLVYPEDRLMAFDAQTAVSALPVGDDPTEEHAMVLYNPNPQARDPTYYTNGTVNPDQVEPEEGKLYRKQLYPNPQARDPTYYTNGTFNPDQVEPEEGKLYRKQLYPNPQARDPTYYTNGTFNPDQVEPEEGKLYRKQLYPNPQARDPTYYTNGTFNPDQVEPEEGKLYRKQLYPNPQARDPTYYTNGTFNPDQVEPEEGKLYRKQLYPNPQARDPTYYTNGTFNPDQVEPEEGKLYRKQLYPNPQARDPTYYTNGTFNPDQVEPEEGKLYRKQLYPNPQARDPTYYTNGTFNPDQVEPEEGKLYRKQLYPNPQARDPTYYTNGTFNPDQVEPEEGKLYRKQLYPNPQARDPTYYTNGTFNPDQVEPEGDKVCRKQSVFATGTLMNDVHRESKREEENRRERAAETRRKKRRDSMGERVTESFEFNRKNTQPVSDPSEEGFEDDQGYYYNERILPEPEGLTSDEVEVKKKKKRKSKKTKKSDSSRDQKKDNMGGKLKRTLSWKQENIPVDINFDANSNDTPSVLTRHNDGRGEQEHQGGAPSNPYCRNDDGGGHSRSRPETSKEKKGRTAHQERNTGKKKKNSIFAGVTRASSMFVRDGISSIDSYHVESEEEDTGMHRRGYHGMHSSASN
eukprot:CAMPEP_0172328612 /NCGR_PEP_ID=MMETSP1058-20130122/60441_1 /TAXON_ID=83371 /ORGANISM="Detonula confervacea, Strain CCMP 353" /LENGTH=1378 /DNA_ID=CAMNT_0013045733 /DNA_START=151 /DNA_END=4288 /DNA_ORIENTATION=-